MQKLFIALGAIVLIVGGFYAFNNYIYNEKQADFVVGETVEFVGEVLAVDLDQMAYDGPALINLQDKDGVLVTVAVPSMGLPLCPAFQANNIGDVSLIKVGDEFEVKGLVSEDGSIVPCESGDHYLRPTPFIVENFEGEADPSKMTLTMKTWSWISTIYNNDTKIEPKTPGIFTITFNDDGMFSATTDCNDMGGSYSAKGSSINFSKVVQTLKYCDGSQEEDFAKLFSEATSYHFTSKGELVFDLKFDSGTTTFK